MAVHESKGDQPAGAAADNHRRPRRQDGKKASRIIDMIGQIDTVERLGNLAARNPRRS
jgi:hypothetical protein